MYIYIIDFVNIFLQTNKIFVKKKAFLLFFFFFSPSFLAENVGNLGWNYHVFQVAKGKSQNTDLYISYPILRICGRITIVLCIRNYKNSKGRVDSMLVVIDSFHCCKIFNRDCVVAWNSKFHYFWVLTISKILAHFVEEDWFELKL